MRVSKPPQERRTELLLAARQLFDQRGVEKTKVSDIVGQIGVSQGVFYYYFPSKENIVDEVVRQVSSEINSWADAVIHDETAPFCLKLAGFIELYIHLIDQFLGDDETQLSPPQPGQEGSRPLTEQCAVALDEKLCQLVRQGEQTGEVTAEFAWEAAQVVLYGLRKQAEEKLPTRCQIYTIAERALGLPANGLVQYMDKRKNTFLRSDKLIE